MRKQAAAGDAAAAIELGRLYLIGARGLAANHRLALDYLKPHLQQQPALRDEVVRIVPLELLVALELRECVAVSAGAGEPVALRKLALWCALGGDAQGWQPLRQLCAQDGRSEAAQLESLLADATLGDLGAVLDQLLPQAVNGELLRLALDACLARLPHADAVRRALLRVLHDAEAGREPLEPLEPARVGAWLGAARHGSAYLNYVYGCALLGFACGRMEPQQLVPKRNFRLGYARLLRAAHGGYGQAWWALYKACSDYRSVVANREAAEFFLERAAACGDLQAHRVMNARPVPRAAARFALAAVAAAPPVAEAGLALG